MFLTLQLITKQKLKLIYPKITLTHHFSSALFWWYSCSGLGSTKLNIS